MTSKEDPRVAWLKEDYDHVVQQLEAIRNRLKAAILDAIEEHGMGSPEHLRLRHALSGENEGRASDKAFATVWDHDSIYPMRPDGPTATAGRLAKLREAMATDPRWWWTSGEVDEFIAMWERVGLPGLTLQDATGERLTLWCVDPRTAAALLGLGESADEDGSFEICKGDYSVGIVPTGT